VPRTTTTTTTTCITAANKRVFQIQYTSAYDDPTPAGKLAGFKAEVCGQLATYNMHSILRERDLNLDPYRDCDT